MKAMILAAGLGTRLRPLTNNRPKALVEIGGIPLLEHVINKLKKAGVTEIIVNTYHFAEQITDFLRKKNHFAIRIEISPEDELLDTGGGLKNAGWFFDDGKPFILYNTDVLSTIDLSAMYAAHLADESLVTLAVRQRKSSRYFLFDETNKLVGWQSKPTNETRIVTQSAKNFSPLSFMGIHIISPQIFALLTETGAFSIVDAYLRLAGEGHIIRAFRADEYLWLDLGRVENLQEAEKLMLSGKLL